MRHQGTTGKIAPPSIPGMELAASVSPTPAVLALAAAGCATLALGVGLLALARPGGSGPFSIQDGTLWVAAAGCLVGLALLHEAGHALAARLVARLPWRRIDFQAGWTGIRCRIVGRVSARDQRRIGLAPLVVTALPLVLASVVVGGQLATLAAVIALLYLPRDLADLWVLRRARPHDVVLTGGDGRTHLFRPEGTQEPDSKRT